MLSKDEFIDIMSDIERTYKFQKSLTLCYSKNNIEGYLVQPDCLGTSLRLLHKIYEEQDMQDWIDTFCFKLDFGKKWKSGSIRNKNGTEVKLATFEDLYYLLGGVEQ